MKVKLILGLCLAVCVAAVGCKSGPVTHLNALPAPNVASDWHSYAQAKAGISLAAPQPWSDSPGGMLDITSDPGVVASVNTPYGLDPASQDKQDTPEADATEGKVLTLYDRSQKPIPGEPRTQMTLTKTVGRETNLDSEVADYKKDLIGLLSDQRVTLDIGPVHEFILVTKTRGGDTISKVVYLAADGGNVYKFEFVTANDLAPLLDAARKILPTFRVAPPQAK